jgi:hypothetical protein
MCFFPQVRFSGQEFLSRGPAPLPGDPTRPGEPAYPWCSLHLARGALTVNGA